MVATPVKLLNAAVEPKYMSPRRLSTTVDSTRPQSGMPSFSLVVPNQRLPLIEQELVSDCG